MCAEMMDITRDESKRILRRLGKFHTSLLGVEKEGRQGGDSTHLPPVWPSFTSRTQCYLSVEF